MTGFLPHEFVARVVSNTRRRVRDRLISLEPIHTNEKLGYAKYTIQNATVISCILWLLYFTDFKEKLPIKGQDSRSLLRVPRTHLVDEIKYGFKSEMAQQLQS
jgi:hypothetical protein